MQYHLEACWTSRHFQVPFKHSLGGSEALDIPLISSITEVKGCQVYQWSLASEDYADSGLLQHRCIAVLQSTLMNNLFPPLDDEKNSLAVQREQTHYCLSKLYPILGLTNFLTNTLWFTLSDPLLEQHYHVEYRRLWVNVPRQGEEGFSWRWPGPPDSEFCSCASGSDWRLTQVYATWKPKVCCNHGWKKLQVWR